MVDAVTVRKGTKKAEFAFVGGKAWHGLGSELKAGAKIETWREAAGMDWSVEATPMTFNAGGEDRVVEGKQILYRSDNFHPLGQVSDRYQVVQPGEVLEFFRDLCDNNGFALNTAGTLFEGKRFWALASVGETAEIVSGDPIKAYLLLATSADGSLATTAQFTSIRVVCNNTLTWSLKAESKSKSKVRVSHRSVFQPEDVKDDLGIVRQQFVDMADAARKTAKVKMPKTKADEFLSSLLTDSKTISSGDPASTKSFKAIMELFEGKGQGADLKGVEGTGWGLVNAITEYVDHHQTTKSIEHRMSDAFFGRGTQLKTMAFDRMLELA